MGIRKASPPALLGGAARVLEWINAPNPIRIDGNNLTGGWQLEQIYRGGGMSAPGTLNALFDNGGAGYAGNRGKGFTYYRGMRTLHMGRAGTLVGPGQPNDQFCKCSLAVLTERPAALFAVPLSAWEVVVVMARRSNPVAPIIADLGMLCLTNTQTTGYAGDFRANTGNAQAGFAVFYDGIGGGLRWVCRNVLAGAALTESVDLGVNPGLDFVKVVIRLTGATPTADAALRVIVNDSVLLTRNWGAGTVLPSVATIPAWGGAFRSLVRNSDTGAGGDCDLSVAYWAIRAADSEALLAAP